MYKYMKPYNFSMAKSLSKLKSTKYEIMLYMILMMRLNAILLKILIIIYSPLINESCCML